MGVTTPARDYFPGMGQAVADRTVNRKIVRPFDQPQMIPFLIPRDDSSSLDDLMAAHAKSQGYDVGATGIDYHVEHGDDVAVSGFFWAYGRKEVERWADVAARVAHGNALLDPRPASVVIRDQGMMSRLQADEFDRMHHHLRQASLLMSGRHLQHGDETQPTRNIEVYTNCATAASTFLLFYLLLNGSGVGRAYDDAMIKADLNKMPIVVCTIGWSHKDVEKGIITGYPQRRDVEHLYAGRKINVFDVPDSREGWAKAIEIIERMAFEERRDEVLILDFTGVREKNAPIKGMQGRPASGPGPLMAAIMQIAKLRDAGMAPWRAALFADHYAAECVLVGGARRAARMATKHWKDPTVLDFIQVKRGGFLWSSNNSVTVDQEFREAVKKVERELNGYTVNFRGFKDWQQKVEHLVRPCRLISADEAHAYKVMMALAEAAYHDGTGEPGLINQDRLTANYEGLDGYLDGLYAESAKFKLDAETLPLMRDLAKAAIESGHAFITNPCGEIVLFQLGGYCVIADVVPFHAGYSFQTNRDSGLNGLFWDDDAEDAFRTATRALIRTNLMDSLYKREVARTNRIGVGITGFHEWAYARFKFTWHDLVDEEKSQDLWLTMSRFKRAIVDEAEKYSKELGVVTPHTNTTFKPAGTTSKLFGLTEGAHLPSMREFIRWVQFRNDDPLVAEYEEKGFPIKRLKQYEGTTVVGFPTKPAICELDGGDWVVTAAEATPEEQYQFLRLLEKYWLTGVEEDGVTPLAETGNQISYTLKYDPKKVSFERFLETLIEGQFSIRACSVMPQTDTTAYEYQPEQPVTKAEFEHIAAAIQADDVKEDIGFEHVDCSTGACPVDFNTADKAA
ncbi:ribonucleoside-diphosphate reductase [Bradyrhizobium sp. 179]|uniref:ribonucleoside-diphosphate reductase n=1 Tax=Bradyrhizobium sp. 179 TaxID=2782648 RepID=UPI001FF739A0|nr:ribonucleoside-diphosphate reductase [Bradyrhizobium sp. 179]MCK1543335.1 ribonucleoside-diphosphate reductase [Bradyrhizobium sp. 179]